MTMWCDCALGLCDVRCDPPVDPRANSVCGLRAGLLLHVAESQSKTERNHGNEAAGTDVGSTTNGTASGSGSGPNTASVDAAAAVADEEGRVREPLLPPRFRLMLLLWLVVVVVALQRVI